MLLIRPYAEKDSGAFRSLNLAWIEAFFTVELEDLAQLDNPKSHILDKGGRILIAEYAGEAVGTVGLVPLAEPGTVELIKMSTREDMQGQGIGKALMAGALDAARAMGARKIWLETNSKLGPALNLYRRAGFRELSASERVPTPYARCNCQMERFLTHDAENA